MKEDIEGEPEYIYTQSYLGFGLMSARKSIILSNLPLPQLSNSPNIVINHPCFSNQGINGEIWKFEGQIYEISGDTNRTGGNGSFNLCYELARQFVASPIHKPTELRHRQIYALSYYFDRAADVGLINKRTGAGVVRVRDFYLSAYNICTGGIKIRRQSPFLCLDLTYIAAFFNSGLGLDWQKEIKVHL